jgi:hypothetical protein
VFAILVNPTSPAAETVSRDVQSAARALGQTVHILSASTEGEVDGRHGVEVAADARRHRGYSPQVPRGGARAEGRQPASDEESRQGRNFATISSGLYRFLAITVLLDVKDILQVGPLEWERIISD